MSASCRSCSDCDPSCSVLRGSAEEEGLRVLVLVSGGGTNLQALIDAQKAGRLGGARIVGVVSDRKGVYALERARSSGIQSWIEEGRIELPPPQRREELSSRILTRARDLRADLIVLAGYLSILKGELIADYAGRIVNLHPALLPKFGGMGMWGDKVHRAVLDSGDTESGCTVHFVDSGTDTGTIILQRKVPVLAGDTIESLASRIHVEEHLAMVEAVAMLAKTLNHK